MTPEQEAQRYDEALARARKLQENSNGMILKKWLWNIFPELKENEDNRMRKDIMQTLKRYIKCVEDGYDAPSAKDFVVKEIEKQIAWLEKQGNNPATIDIDSMITSYKQRLKSQTGIGIGVENNPIVNMCITSFRRGVENTLEELNLKKLGQPEVTKTSDQKNTVFPSLKDFQEAFELKARQYDIKLPNRGYDIHAMCKELYSFLIKQKPAWSEDDEHRVKDTIYFLDTAKKHYASTVELDACIDWLKSLKQRIGG